MCSPMPAPICLVENVNGSLLVSDSAITYLRGISQPVVVVSIVGLYRTGKSYLMNRLAGKERGFALGSTIESKTKGIWMWCVPHPANPNHTLVLLDTEGLGDIDKGDSKNDAWIFCLAVLLSSTLVYNSRGTIDNQALENLHYVTELAEQIKIKSPASAQAEDEDEEDFQFVRFFPNFIWTVRDFVLDLVIENKGQVSEDEYLDFALQLKKGTGKKISNYNLPRQCIRNYFPTRKCFVFPLPATQDKMTRLESLSENDIWPDFLKVTQHFCDHVFTVSEVKTLKGGQRVTGRMFGHLVQSYVETISSGKVPCLENAVVAMAKIENQASVEEAVKLYQSGMEQVKILFPVGLSKIYDEHQKLTNMATAEFTKHSFKDEQGEYLKKLTEEIEKHFAELLVQNMEKSEIKCQKLLSDLYLEISEHLQQGEYAKPGGYKLYSKHKESIINKYHSQPDKGVSAEDVLGKFLNEKRTEADMILQTDTKLTVQEKKIEEEKERSALLDLKCKAENKRIQELEKMMTAAKQHSEELLQQFMKKFEEENLQQKQELDKAVEKKMHDEKELLQKGFEEQAQSLNREVQQLKKQSEEVSSSNYMDYAKYAVDVGKDLLALYLQYKVGIQMSGLKLPI
ncbi:guanylate-binding protein 1-like [Trichomycterus rosablanca]|uniref:guanylate-binding protein 1-like n=1 Tax=Trichomycterus rosablanca TaxID=2290929 RepID=UPI002F354141